MTRYVFVRTNVAVASPSVRLIPILTRTAHIPRRAAVASVLASVLALPAAARANELTDLLTKKSPNEVVQFLLDALAKNDAPSPDAGLKTFVKAASPANPATADPAKFISVIKSSPYSILLGKYDAMRMAKANEGFLKRSVHYLYFRSLFR